MEKTTQTTENQAENIKIVLKKYKFNDILKPDQAEQYAEICAQALKLGHKKFDYLAAYSQKESAKMREMPEVQHVETEFLFNNQYNTAEGFRVHDWSEPIYQNKFYREGYFIAEGLKELEAAKNNQFVCGYCGKRHDKKDVELKKLIFCDSCLGSEYLKESDLPLLLLIPVTKDNHNVSRHKLAANPPPELAANYKAAQEAAKIERAARHLERLKRRAAEEVAKAHEENAANLYEAQVKAAFMTAGFDPQDLIFYKHSNEWCFGWRSEKPTPEEKAEFIRVASDLTERGLIPTDKNGVSMMNLITWKGC